MDSLAVGDVKGDAEWLATAYRQFNVVFFFYYVQVNTIIKIKTRVIHENNKIKYILLGRKTKKRKFQIGKNFMF